MRTLILIWQIFKGLAVILAVLWILETGFKKLTGMNFLGMSDSEGEALHDIVNSTLNIPYFKRSFVIETPEYIKTFTQEEWMNVKCEVGKWHKWVFGSSYAIPIDQEPYISCIYVHLVGKVSKEKDVNGELCPNFAECQILNLAVDHYILQYPEIIKSILKIVERPCDYIKQFDKKLTYDEVKNKSFSDPLQEEYEAQTKAEQARSHLRCDKSFFLDKIDPPPKFVIISICDWKNKQVIAEFIVRRQDIY